MRKQQSERCAPLPKVTELGVLLCWGFKPNLLDFTAQMLVITHYTESISQSLWGAHDIFREPSLMYLKTKTTHHHPSLIFQLLMSPLPTLLVLPLDIMIGFLIRDRLISPSRNPIHLFRDVPTGNLNLMFLKHLLAKLGFAISHHVCWKHLPSCLSLLWTKLLKPNGVDQWFFKLSLACESSKDTMGGWCLENAYSWAPPLIHLVWTSWGLNQPWK